MRSRAVVAAVLALVLAAAPVLAQEAPRLTVPLSILVGLHGADAATSCAVFAQGGRELNPLLPGHCRGAVAVQGAAALVPVIGLRKISETHPTWARRLAWIAVVAKAAVVAWNVTQLRRTR